MICVDLLICQFPGMKDFRIQESNGFLAASLSLSFGVMVRGHVMNLPPPPGESYESTFAC